ncbi:hypothetical protein WG922_17755 [Ramlibacter sp. AN1015]|uniref:hypothetical protein n=1 Tax=Ramlibacter sp. AN1015 TaxID=3133428 RepID=UPI0030C57796
MRRLFLLLPLLAATSITTATRAQEIGTEAWYAVPDQRGVQRVHVECGRDYLDPREIVVQPGIPVELEVRSAQPDEEFDAGPGGRVRLDRQHPRTVRFTPAARGRHVLACGQRGAGGPGAANPRKRGLLHVDHPRGREHPHAGEHPRGGSQP